MQQDSAALIGEITDFEIQLMDDAMVTPSVNGEALTASMEVKVHDDYYVFGGPSLFLSIPNQGGSDFFGHFVARCLQTVGVSKAREFAGELIKVKLHQGKIYGISSLRSDDFFYPADEFEMLKKGEVNSEDFA